MPSLPFRRGPGGVPATMARSVAHNVLAASAIIICTTVVGKGLKRCLRNGKRNQRKEGVPQEAEVLLHKLFGEENSMCVMVEAISDSETPSDSAAADWETFRALKVLFALVLAAFATICFAVCAISSGDVALLAAAALVARFLVTPAAVEVRKHWGRALDEALDESIKTTGVPWDLAVI